MSANIDSDAGASRRRDLDGLRALAVVAILIFHAAPTLAPGGFVGVDVFFVLSGFLITGIVADERETGRFGFARFYLRRARRILPAYVVVLAAVAIAAWVVMMPREMATLGWALGGSALFLANVVFAQGGGYFEPMAEQSPLLHLWSLSVEEQFYLLWPWLILGLSWPPLRRFRLALALALLVGSLAAAQALVTHNGQRIAFFHLPFRAWEFMLGAVLALGAPAPPRRAAAEGAVGLGLLLIVGSVALLNADAPFPGLHAVPATLGAALVIWGGANASAAAPLRWRPVVGLGLVSYSLYLWHWPLLVFSRLLLGRPLTMTEGLAVAAASLPLAALSWRFVEQPWRGTAPTPRLRQLAYAASPLAVLLGVGVAALSTGGLPARLPPRVSQLAALEDRDVNPRRKACFDATARLGRTPPACRGAAPVQVLVWGDSHADAVTPGVALWASRQGYAVQQSTYGGCPPLAGVRTTILGMGRHTGCGAFNASILREIAMNPDLKLIVLAARWPLYARAKPDYDINSPRVRIDDTWRPRTAPLDLAVGLDRTLAAIAATGTKAQVLVVGPVPELTFSPPLCMARATRLHADVAPCATADARLPLMRSRIAEERLKLALARHPDVAATWPAHVLCHGGRCEAERDGRLLYFDDDHLSASAARLFVPGWLDQALDSKRAALTSGPPRSRSS